MSRDTEIERLQQWVNDLQSGMYINCVYCGHRYGPQDEVPASMADVLKQHVEQCPEHPMSELKANYERACQDLELASQQIPDKVFPFEPPDTPTSVTVDAFRAWREKWESLCAELEDRERALDHYAPPDWWKTWPNIDMNRRLREAGVRQPRAGDDDV